MRKWLILLSALCGTSASGAPAWTWVDANGTVHFSDTPVAGARQIEMAGAQGFGLQAEAQQPGVRTTVPGARSTPRSNARGAGTAAVYQSVEVVSPTEQQTFHNIGGVLNVILRSDPGLEPGHRYDLVLDGQRRNVNAVSSNVALTDVFRGTHTLEVVVIDSAGAELARSPPRTFHVQQVSILNRN